VFGDLHEADQHVVGQRHLSSIREQSVCISAGTFCGVNPYTF
jgi:hypothetical protein